MLLIATMPRLLHLLMILQLLMVVKTLQLLMVVLLVVVLLTAVILVLGPQLALKTRLFTILNTITFTVVTGCLSKLMKTASLQGKYGLIPTLKVKTATALL